MHRTSERVEKMRRAEVEEAGNQARITVRGALLAKGPDSFIGQSAQEILLRQHPHGRGKGGSQSSGGRSGR